MAERMGRLIRVKAKTVHHRVGGDILSSKEIIILPMIDDRALESEDTIERRAGYTTVLDKRRDIEMSFGLRQTEES